MCAQDRGSGVDDAQGEPDFEPVGAVETWATLTAPGGIVRRPREAAAAAAASASAVRSQRETQDAYIFFARVTARKCAKNTAKASRSARRTFLGGGCRQRAYPKRDVDHKPRLFHTLNINSRETSPEASRG